MEEATKLKRKWNLGIHLTDKGALLPPKPLGGITEDQKFGAMSRSSAIFWEEEAGKENQVISMNAQVAQSLSMAITSHCVVELSSSEALSLF